MKYIFKRDTIFATAAVFLLILAFKKLPLNLHLFDPINAALSDVQFNDLAFSKISKEKNFDKDIIIVNVDTANRKDLAQLLAKLGQYNTAAIGLDLLFVEAKEDTATDNNLGQAMQSLPNLVVAEKIKWTGDTIVIDNFYATKAVSGFANFIGENKGVIRHYSPFEKTASATYKSFTSAIIEKADINHYKILEERNHETEIINYKRSADNYIIIDWTDIVNNAVDSSLFNNKIVLCGFIDKTGFNIEDKHYTPLNSEFLRKRLPDMDGVIIHANILSMIKADDYIRKVPTWLTILLAILLTHIHIALFINYYIHNHKWFHIRFKAVQLLSSILFIYIGILLLRVEVYFDFTLLLAAVVLSVDVLYFYEGFANWLEKKYSFKTIFTHSSH